MYQMDRKEKYCHLKISGGEKKKALKWPSMYLFLKS